jgi:hypothetical protein
MEEFAHLEITETPGPFSLSPTAGRAPRAREACSTPGTPSSA